MESTTRKALLCAKCQKIMIEPRVSRCGHSFCKKCLENLLQTYRQSSEDSESLGSINQQISINFRCPIKECGNEYTISSPNIDFFPPNINIAQMIEEENLRNTAIEAKCSKHIEKPKELFCITCKKDLCTKCLVDHVGHDCRDKDQVIQFFIENCKKASNENQEKTKNILENISKLNEVIKKEEEHVENELQYYFELFSWIRQIITNEEELILTYVIHGSSQQSPLRATAAQEKSKWPLFVNDKILKPVINHPGKRVMEPKIVLDIVEESFKNKNRNFVLPKYEENRPKIDKKEISKESKK